MTTPRTHLLMPRVLSHLVRLLVLLLCVSSAVHGLRVSSATLSNASVGATTDLLLAVDFQGAHLPVDAVFTATLHPDMKVTDGVSGVDTTLLAAQVDGTLQVATQGASNSIVVTRAADGSARVPSGDVVFKLTLLTAPSVAGYVSLGSFSFGDSTTAELGVATLPSLWIAPGAIWSPTVAFDNLISSRTSAFSITFTPAHAVPVDGFVLVHLPRLYTASSVLQAITLVGADGVADAVFILQVGGSTLRLSQSSRGGSAVALQAMQTVVLYLGQLQHPLLEGPIGRTVRVDTTDAQSNVIDQGLVDVTGIFLERATVVLNLRQIALQNASDSGSYTISLSAPPQFSTTLSVAMTALTPVSLLSSASVVLTPSLVTFSTSNWTVPVAVDVRAAANYSSLPAGERFLVSHSILPAGTETSFAGVHSVYVTIYDDAACCLQNGTSCGRCTACPAGSYCGEGSVTPTVCPDGTFSFENGARPCQICPAGYSCDANEPAPVKCPDGSYSLAGDPQCHLCGTGMYCPTTTLAPVQCAQGFYSFAGATTCTACPAGYECPVTAAAPLRCSAGAFAPVGSTLCTPCPAGSYCPQPSVDPIACPAWHFSSVSSTACTPCPAGKDCSSASSAPVDCPSGTYSITQATQCTPCPAGASCAQPSAEPVTCLPGTFSIGGQAQCTVCSAGFYCPYTNQNTQLVCASGTYAEAGATVCTSCPAGKQCPSTSQKVIQSCAAGTFSIGGQTQCTDCPAGHKCPSVDGSQNAPCPAGYYAAAISTQCTQCQVGSYCPEGSVAPAACPNGTFSFENGARPCELCPAGYSCNATDFSPAKCSDGSYSLAGDTQCHLCEPGMYCPTSTLAPVQCAQGFYSLAGATTCAVCPFGYVCNYPDPPIACDIGETNNRNHSACIACPAGFGCSPLRLAPTACVSGTFSLEGGGECTQCPKGYECPVTAAAPLRCSAGSFAPVGSTLCTPCPAGSYCPQPSVDPIACPAWHFSSVSSTACTPCPAGKDCSSASSAPVDCPSGTYSITQATQCTPCPAGASCAQPSAEPVTCLPGTFSIGGQAQCTVCSAGFYCPYTNQNTQLVCASGTYAEAGATVCTSCPAGKQCPSTSQKVIQSCAAGTFSIGGQTQCTDCPAGHKCPSVDGSQNAPCPAGSYAMTKSTQCTTCPAGSSCPDSSIAPIQCPLGSFSTGVSSSCVACTPGYACPDTTSNQRTSCAAGTYSMAGSASCTPCPAGYACLFTNSSSFSPCPPGWYSPEGNAACVECPRGYYCDVPYEMPKNCSVGSYSLKTSTSCTPCDPGYECPRSDQLPQPCPVGYYSEGAVANCRACRPGYKCGLAATNPTPPEDACPMGGYCNPPTTFFLCPAGTYGNVTAGESVDQACAPCPEGFYCEMGSTPLTAQRCPTGFVCPLGTKRASQYPCPAGTYNSLPSKLGFDACLLCPAGSFCPEGSSSPVVCPQGYFCLEGTVAANQYPCPAGTYSGPQTGLSVASQCHRCELGSYCPEASSTPTQCPAGTYNPATGSADVHECLDCPPGWSCPRVGQFEYVDRCAKGHYCPSGTVVATANPCPAGTYTERVDLIRASDCTICPLRHACPQGTGGDNQTMLDCGAGFFCPNGTAYSQQFPCPPGSWSSSTSLADASECEICPVGKYCSGGKSFIDGPCSPGYYCPLGTPSATKFPCPAGTYTSKTWLFESSQCDDCPPGYYCPAGSVAPIPCKAGSYSPVNNTKSVGPGAAWPDCVLCPAGFYCVDGSVVPVPCGNGNFSPKGSKSCSKCEAGYFCSSNTTSDTSMRSDVVSWLAPGSQFGKCYNGTYCATGTDHEPALEIDACPRGYFCPKATPAPIICPAGTYSNLTGQDELSDCIPTPAGFFSLAGALQPTGPCDPGYYCPLRSTTRMQVPCPARYYLDRTGGSSEEDCAVCVAGSYCPRGTAYPVACPTGFYCRTGVSTPEPCPIGTYSNATGIKQVEDCLQCPPGMYCDSTGLTVPRGPCDPGYYCTLGSYTSAPMNYETTLFGVTNRNVGGQCPRGSYCPLGSAFPTACPPGTYNNFTGLETDTQCVLCPPGKYCGTPGLFLPTGDCFSGYYCTGGASIPTQVATPVGHFTGNGSTAPVPCPAGQFNSYEKQDQCVDCPAGFYCESPGTIRPMICPPGSYCPKATALAFKCPPGTFGDAEGLIAILQCKSCPAGYFCDSFGLTVPSGKCFEGFVCSGGSPVANPVNPDFGYVCPVGNYCPVGSGAATQCPSGTFRPSIGGANLTSCTSCPGGSYCGGSALTAPTDLCGEGYFCTMNASSATPTDQITGDACPAGYYCPRGTINPIQCAAGTYASSRGSVTCKTCPEGFFCDGITTDRYFDCPAGFYCPLGTGAVQVSCHVGSFSSSIKLVNSTQCTNCTAGSYCDRAAITSPTGLCSVGYFCPPSSQTAFGKTPENTTHPCPRGSFCPQGTYIPTPCPLGTYSNMTALGSAQQCTACAEGMFCGSTGLTSPSGPCDPGFYCRRGNAVATPNGGVTTADGVEVGGDLCPKGSFCLQGSAQPVLCPEGSYSDDRGVSVCPPCPAGYFCPLGSTSYSSNMCPQGYYCPVGTKRDVQYPCLPGTFGNRTGLQDVSQCTPAPGGTYIEGYAAVKTTGLCKSGFYCSGGSASSTPTGVSSTGGPCLPGTNCPEGSAVPIVCDAGFYCSSTNTDKALPCDAGFYCVQGSYTANPTGQNNSLGIIGNVCSPGHYCPQGTSNPIPCPPGTFSENTQNTVASQCFPCPPGFLCSVSGIVTPYEKCPAGSLCLGGEREATQRCPQGYECPEGSSSPKICPAGTFSDEQGLSQCKLCPERYYCEAETITPSTCPAGFFCPLQTPSATKYPCPPGTFSNTSLLASSSECTACTPGKFCSGAPPTDRPTGDCAPGHFCASGALTATPTDGTTGDFCAGGHVCIGGAWLPTPLDGVTGTSCQPGYYCPRGSSLPIRCAKGTYNAFEKQSACAICPAGGYCDTNTTAPVPCPLRFYCPAGTVEPVLCPAGTYGHTTGLDDASQCAACSAGKYCVGGTITASCAAGYYCKLYNLDPNPALNLTVPAIANKSTGFDFGGPCPIGHYCPEGVLDPMPCPNTTARLETHGTSVDDCGPCPAGWSCENGALTVPCPAGFYCTYAQSALPCPLGTYNPTEGRARLEDCKACDAGKLCNRTAIVELTDWYDCPSGHYCPPASIEPVRCPAGRFRRDRGAKSVTECSSCPGGSHCGIATVEPSVCESRVYCPVGSGEPTVCPGGAYCPQNTTLPVVCPAGFYCSMNVSSPTACDRGFYCPRGSVAPLACPLGYIGRVTPLNGVLSVLTDACEACPAGNYGIDPNRTKCEPCIEGYVCLEATKARLPKSKETDNGYPCPPGHYCPASCSKEIPCPSGTYQPNSLAINASACLPCPENSYQNAIGQASCLPCSKSAYAGVGATKCTCKGSHRAFQMTDGYCICEPGYEFYDQDMILRSDEDDDVDCQPIVYDRCGSSQVRSDGGGCVSASHISCENSCGNSSGTLVSSMGICQCEKQTDVDTICDKKCRESAMQVRVSPTTGELELYDPVSRNTESVADGSDTGVVSKVSCPSDGSSDCQLHSVALSSTGFSGSYDVPKSMASPATSASSAARQRQRRRLDASSSIQNPMVCLQVGQGILFDLSTSGSYPVYMKDSMLNTNPTFDYGAFRALAVKIKSNSSTVSAFAFSFTEAGIYVFGNSLNGAAKTVVTVMKTGTSCPTEAAIVPLSEKNLISVSVKRRTDDIILAPDWGLIIGLLGGLVGIVAAVIAGLYYFRTKSWAASSFRKRLPGYRAKSMSTNLSTMHSKGAVVKNTATVASAAALGSSQDATMRPAPVMVLDDGKAPGGSGLITSPRWAKSPTGARDDGGYQPDLGRWDEEDVDLRELVDRLQYHHEAVTKCFDDQKGDVNKLLQRLQAEAAELKRLFVNSLTASSSSPSRIDPLADGMTHIGEEDPHHPEDETVSTGAVSTMASGRPEHRDGQPEALLAETLERDLKDRERFRRRRNAGMDEIAGLLQTIENWSRNPTEFAHNVIADVASSDQIDHANDEPETTTAPSYLEHVQSVLGDLKTLLCSDPSKMTSSSVIQFADAEKVRREVAEIVVEAAAGRVPAGGGGGDARTKEMLALHERIARAENKEDEVLFEQLASLQRFGEALPKLLAAVDDMEIEFKRELAQVREEQNPSKERAVTMAMEEKLGKFVRELSKGAGRLHDKVQKEQTKLVKAEKATRPAEDELGALLKAARDQSRQKAGAEAALNAKTMEARAAVVAAVETPSTTALAVAREKEGEALMGQIKDLLASISQQQQQQQPLQLHNQYYAQHQLAFGPQAVPAVSAAALPAASAIRPPALVQAAAASSSVPSLNETPVTASATATVPLAAANPFEDEQLMFSMAEAGDMSLPQEIAGDEMEALRQAAEAEAQVQLARQESMRREYAEMLRAKFPQLTADETQRLLDDFSADLLRMGSSQKVEAQKMQEDVKNLLTARAVMAESHHKTLDDAAAKQQVAMRQEQTQETTSLESKFAEEEDEIEKEYQRELARLEQEFAELVDEDPADVGDDASQQNTSREEDGDPFDEMDGGEGDASAPLLDEEADDISDARPKLLTFSTSSALSMAMGSRSVLPSVDIEKLVNNEVDREVARVRDLHAAALADRLRSLEQEAAQRHAQLLARRKAKAASGPRGQLTKADEELLASESRVIDADVASRKQAITTEAADVEKKAVQRLVATGHKLAADVDKQVRECQAAHAADLSRLQEQLSVHQARARAALKARLDQRRRDGTPEVELTKATHESEQLFAEEQRQQLEALRDKQEKELRTLASGLEQTFRERAAEAETTNVDAEAELKRVREEHARARFALAESLAADRLLQESRLRDRLANRRHEKVVGLQSADPSIQAAAMAELGRLDEAETLELSSVLESQAIASMRELCQAQCHEEAPVWHKAMDALAVAKATAVAARSSEATVDDALSAIRSAYEKAMADRSSDEDAEPERRKRALLDRLAKRRKASSSVVGGENPIRVAGEAAEARRDISDLTVANVLNGEIDRVHKLFKQSRINRERELELEGAARKRLLRDRIAASRKRILSKTGDPAETAEELSKVQVEEGDGIAEIDSDLVVRKAQLTRAIGDRQDEVLERVETVTVASADDVERLLAQCKAEHDKEARALRERLALERKKEEESLKERLAKRRKERLAAAPSGDDTKALEAQVAEDERDEKRRLEQQLSQKEDDGQRKLVQQYADASRAVFAKATAQLGEKNAALREDFDAAEAELRRVRDEHARDMAALQASLQADRTARANALKERLDARRRAALAGVNERDSAQVAQSLDCEAESENASLDEQFTREATEKMEERMREHQAIEDAVFARYLEASGNMNAAQASQDAMRGMAEAELARLRRELAKGQQRVLDHDALEAEQRRKRLQDRLERRRQRDIHHNTTDERRSEGMTAIGVSESVPVAFTTVEAIAQAIDDSIEAELKRIRDQHAADAAKRNAELLQDAEYRKALLRDRMARKRAAIQALGSQSTVTAEQVDAEEAAALEAIDASIQQHQVDAEARIADQTQRAAGRAEEAAVEMTDDMEKLLAACRAKFDEDAAALRERLALERQRREQTLHDRLAKKRAQRLATVETARYDAGITITEKDERAIETELSAVEERERAAAEQEIAVLEETSLNELKLKHHGELDDIARQVAEDAARRQVEALADRERAELELKRLQDEHERERRSLASSMDAERKRQQQRLQDKLKQRRAAKTEGKSTPVTAVELAVMDAEDELEVLQLEKELDSRRERALRDERERQELLERVATGAIDDAAAKAAANEATRLAMDAAREAELRRVATELDAALATAHSDEANDAAVMKARLEQRLRAKKLEQKKDSRVVEDSHTKAELKETASIVIPEARMVVAEVMETAVDDEVERIKRQYAEDLQRRVEQIQSEGAARKALLRERMEQKRKALAMRSGGESANARDVHGLSEEEAAEANSIEMEVTAQVRAAEDELRQQEEATTQSFHAAANATGEELERLLAQCQKTHADESEALRRALAQEWMRQEEALRDRLSKRRLQRLSEVNAQGGDKDQIVALEKEMIAEEDREVAILTQSLEDEEAKRLKEAEQSLQRQTAELMEKAEQEARERQRQAEAARSAAELELRRIQDEHARERELLHASLDAERKLQEQKLHDKLNAKRMQREQQKKQAGVQDDQVAVALEAEDVQEWSRLEAELQQQAVQAMEAEHRRQYEEEQQASQQIAQARAIAAAAEAGKKAMEAARQAEIDRIAAEFEATRRRAQEDDSAEAQARRSKLDERLAEKKRRSKAAKKPSLEAAAGRVSSISRNLHAIAESQAEKEITRLQGEHTAACADRFTALEQDAALRKARLAERIAKKRKELPASEGTTGAVVVESAMLEEQLQKEMEEESKAIDESVAQEKQRIADEVARAQREMSLAVQEAAQRNAREMEQLLINCKQVHDEESANLQRALGAERQRQEQALQERIAKRKGQRKKPTAATAGETSTVAATPEASGVDERPSSAEADEEKEKRELEAKLAAKEAQVWEEMRRKQEEELLALTKLAESAALKKQEEAKLVQESAQVELDRLKKDHEEEMASLTASLEAEQKRQQQQLQQRIAARRNKQQKQQKDSQDTEEKKRQAQLLEEQEMADRLALEQQMEAEIARKIEEERERQRRQEAELADRIAKANVDAAAADATRRAMDAAREVELERVAKEFDEKSRDLQQSHMTDLMNQKQKLEARVAAKKQKKLMELEAKRELERQKLKEKQAHEEAAAQAEQDRARESVDDALMLAAGDGDASAPPIEFQEEAEPQPAPAASEIEETKQLMMKKLEERLQKTREDSVASEVAPTEDDEAVRAAQQARDVTAIQQLFDNRVVPNRMPLMAAVELVLSQRHQKETSLLFAQQYKRKTQAIRDALREIMQQKAAAKALVMRTSESQAHESNLKDLDAEYDERIRSVEQKSIQAQEQHAATEAHSLKERQLGEFQFLLNYFSSLHAVAIGRLQQDEKERQAQADQAAKLRGLVGTDNQPRHARLLVFGAEGNEMDDRINDLRARLQLEADERIQQLMADKHAELQRLQQETEAELTSRSQQFDREAEEERAAMDAAYQDRVRLLKADSPQRVVLSREKDAQIASLLLMLQGRRAQHQTRDKRLLAKKLATIEHEFDRKIQIVAAKMMQRLMEEKELLWAKQTALDKATDSQQVDEIKMEKDDDDDGEADHGRVSINPLLGSARSKVTAAARRAKVLGGLSSRAADATNEMVPSDVASGIERRLSTIEALLRTGDREAVSKESSDAGSRTAAVEAYKQAVTRAVEDACQWNSAAGDASDGVLRVADRGAMDGDKLAQLDFANALVHMMEASQEAKFTAVVEHIAIADSLPVTKQAPTYYDPATRTLFVRSACFAQLSVGQLAVLVVHAMAHAQTEITDVADPQFISHVYRLLVRCYDSIFAKSQDDTATTKRVEGSSVSTPPTHTQAVEPTRSTVADQSGRWKSHVYEMESFLSGFETGSHGDDATGSQSPRSPRGTIGPLKRQATAVMAAISMARTSSRFLLTSKDGANEMEALVVQERRQFLLEKLDTAEKLYAHVLRQYQEQKESLEYVQEMVEEEQDREREAKFTKEDKAAHAQRVDEFHHELEAVHTALDETRRERDELFTQCQSLRDELEHLPRSRPTTGAEASTKAQAKSDL